MSSPSLTPGRPLNLRLRSSQPPLTRAADLFVALALVTGAGMLALELGYLLAAKLPYGPDGFLIGRDFVNTWMGARIALTGDPTPWFDLDAYNAALRAVWGPGYPQHLWSYPPHLLLFTWPFGLLPYLPSLVLWLAAGLGFYLMVGLEGRRDWRTILLLVVSPAVVINLFTGQNGFFTAALLIGGLTMLDRRPVLAGVLFGILTIKPQLGVLMPLMLVMTGRWRVIAAAAATIVMLGALAAIAFGPGVWTAYREVAMLHQAEAFLRGTGLFVSMMPTVFMNARVADLPPDLAWIAQALVSVPAVAAVAWAYWRPRDPLLSLALLIAATFVATPYVFSYDMVVFGWLFVRLIERPDNNGWDYALMFAVWTLPAMSIVLGHSGIPVSALVLVAFAARLTWRVATAPSPSARSLPATAQAAPSAPPA